MTETNPDGKICVLVIEDNPGDVEFIRMALQNADLDCEVIVIDEGEEAIEFVRRRGKYADMRAPDLVLLDLNLPRYDGLEILQAMSDNQTFARAPVAVLSSSSSPRDRARIEAFNIGRFITKPADLEEFLQIGLVLKELLAKGTPGGK